MPKSIRNQPEHQYQSAAIPRPLNCFLFYRLDKQKEIVEKCPGANHRDISKIIAKWWKEATDEEKKPYVEKARRAKQEHRKLYPDYKYTPKKKNTPKRMYRRRNTAEQFTSRVQENNELLELIFEDSTVLDEISPVSSIVTKQSKKSSTKKSVDLAPTSPIATIQTTSFTTGMFDGIDYFNYSSIPYNTISTNQQQQQQIVSPFTDVYSESSASPSSASSPCCFSIVDDASTLSNTSRSVSPFSFNDPIMSTILSPTSSESVPPNYQNSQQQPTDYFQFNHSMIAATTTTPVNGNNTQDFCWPEFSLINTAQPQQPFMMNDTDNVCPLLTHQQQQQQYFDYIQFIDPALLLM